MLEFTHSKVDLRGDGGSDLAHSVRAAPRKYPLQFRVQRNTDQEELTPERVAGNPVVLILPTVVFCIGRCVGDQLAALFCCLGLLLLGLMCLWSRDSCYTSTL